MAEKPKIGAGHAGAWMRLGLRELRAAFFPESNIAQQSEYGIVGTKTPGEVWAARRNDAQVPMEQERSGAVATPPRSPSAIAADARSVHGQEQDKGNDQQQDTDKSSVHGSPPRSPSAIAADRSPYMPEQQHGHDQGQGL